MINEPRLKTESFVMCFLFFLPLKPTLKESLLSHFSSLFLELKNHYKHVLNSPWYISGFQAVSLCCFRQEPVTIRLQSFSQFRVTMTLYEMINEPRLKTESFVMCFLFFLPLKPTLKESLLSHFSSLFLELKNHYKHVLNSPWYISGFQAVSLCCFRQEPVTIRLQSFSQFRVTISHYEMINEPRLKTEPFVMCFLFFFVFEVYIEKKFVTRWSHYFEIDKCWF